MIAKMMIQAERSCISKSLYHLWNHQCYRIYRIEACKERSPSWGMSSNGGGMLSSRSRSSQPNAWDPDIDICSMPSLSYPNLVLSLSASVFLFLHKLLRNRRQNSRITKSGGFHCDTASLGHKVLKASCHGSRASHVTVTCYCMP